jgi:EAL domain-containing protein (putative c-di-GMP-specific phosphodiesterase class I)
MWCADCEKIDQYIYETTHLWMHLPTTDSFGKVAALCGANGYEAEQFNSHGIKVVVEKSGFARFITQLYGATNGQERAGTNIVSTEGDVPGPVDLGRVTTLEVFVARYRSQWICDAIEQETSESWYQPIVHADSTADAPQIFAYEALFRMRDDQGTIMPPHMVFQMAEHANLLFSLDLVARRTAVEGAAMAKLPGKLFVNFNPSSVYDPAYCLRTTAAAIHELGMKPADVVFEITETHRVTDIVHLKGILQFYRSAGFGVALDDIGSGWSSLNMLHEFSPDYVKIDMDLCRDIHSNDTKQNIVSHLLSIARKAGIKTIAEGIETESEAAWLREAGADYLQGYLFGKPEPKGSAVSNAVETEIHRATTGLKTAASV